MVQSGGMTWGARDSQRPESSVSETSAPSDVKDRDEPLLKSCCKEPWSFSLTSAASDFNKFHICSSSVEEDVAVLVVAVLHLGCCSWPGI